MNEDKNFCSHELLSYILKISVSKSISTFTYKCFKIQSKFKRWDCYLEISKKNDKNT